MAVWSGSYTVAYGEKPLSSAKYNSQIVEIFDHLADLRITFAGSAYPTDVEIGQMCWRIDTSTLAIWDGSDWQPFMLETSLNAHIEDTLGAHAASAISVADGSGYFSGINVETVLTELYANILAHIGASDNQHKASAVTITDTGGFMVAGNVEAALQEIYTDFYTNHTQLDSLAHAAGAIALVDAGALYTADDVEAALAEVMTNLNEHMGGGANHSASAITITDAGSYYAASDVEAALQEIYVDLVNHGNQAVGAHAASSINIVDSNGYFTAIEVETALEELYERFTYLTSDQAAAITGANSPSAANVFATMTDVSELGAGDMLKSTYDTNANGKVDTADNALLLGGYAAGNASGQIPIANGTKCTNLNADTVDGYSAGDFAANEHNHNTLYASISHNHSGVYAPYSHSHSGYALTSHTHTGVYAAYSHTHNYATVGGASKASRTGDFYIDEGSDTIGVCWMYCDGGLNYGVAYTFNYPITFQYAPTVSATGKNSDNGDGVYVSSSSGTTSCQVKNIRAYNDIGCMILVVGFID